MDAINDYLLDREGVASIEALRYRLGHVETYIEHVNGENSLTFDAIDERWVEKFRVFARKMPIISPKSGQKKARSEGYIEGSVRALHAAANFAFNRGDTAKPPQFKPRTASSVSITPLYRADVQKLAEMFEYALGGPDRVNLLRFLQASVATWGRPDAIYDLSTAPERRQWLPEASVVALNPAGRDQTRKYRATVPVGDRFALLLNATSGFYVPVKSVRRSFNAMRDALGLPGDGESAQKLIRRSISHIVRKRIGEEHWVQGQIMLGHHKASTSDIYALPDPANLGRASQATTDVIEEIISLVPNAFSRHNTGLAPEIREVRSAKK